MDYEFVSLMGIAAFGSILTGFLIEFVYQELRGKRKR